MREDVFGAVKQVLGLFVQGFEIESECRRAFEVDLRDLVAPHMPVLTRRRAKLLETCGPERWSDELDAFMRQSLWPFLGAGLAYAERNRAFVTLILDIAIEREQRRNSLECEVAVPLASRFDTSWAS